MMFATITSDNKDDLVGHEVTVHEGICFASDSDIYMNDSMEDCEDDFNGGSAMEDGGTVHEG